jgi:outer membrane protein OmpA-like peptidoglycan-associated protein
MRKVLTMPCRWSSLAAILLAVAFFMPAKELVAQMPASSKAPEFTQNVKEVYFPFNIYNRVIDTAVLDSDAAWLKQHPDAHFWIESYADIRGDIFYNLVLSYRRSQFIKDRLIKSE